MKVQIKKKVVELMGAMLLAFSVMGCTEADQVSRNISKEADNFNVTRKLMSLKSSSRRMKESIRKIMYTLMSIPCMWLRTSPVPRLINIIMKSTSCQSGDLKPLTASNLCRHK